MTAIKDLKSLSLGQVIYIYAGSKESLVQATIVEIKISNYDHGLEKGCNREIIAVSFAHKIIFTITDKFGDFIPQWAHTKEELLEKLR